jgi:hypothetical protein
VVGGSWKKGKTAKHVPNFILKYEDIMLFQSESEYHPIKQEGQKSFYVILIGKEHRM